MQHKIHIHTKEEAIIELSKRLQDAISQNNMLYAKLQDLKTVKNKNGKSWFRS